MTCIVGLIDDITLPGSIDGSDIYIGGDSAGVEGYGLTVRADEKVFINGGFIMGFTGSFRIGQLLRYSLKPPIYHPDVDLFQYMVTDFIDAVRECLKKGGYAQKKDEVEQAGTFLVGFKNKLFKIDSDYQVGQPYLYFDACGCGEDIALGAMYAGDNLPPEERIIKALEAAEQFSAGVRHPFIIKHINKERSGDE